MPFGDIGRYILVFRDIEFYFSERLFISCVKIPCDIAKFKKKTIRQGSVPPGRSNRIFSMLRTAMDFGERSIHNTGFTLAELLVVISIIAFVSAVGIPSVIKWIPNYRLKSAALDLFSNFQAARIRAMQSRSEYGIRFNVWAGNYQLVSGGANKTLETEDNESDDIIEKTVFFSNYGSGIRYGYGNAAQKASQSGGAFSPGDEVSYLNDTAEFNSRGMTNRMGYVYLENSIQSTFAVSTPTMAGVVHIKRWNGKEWR
jgi:type IV fimbrial biogenesis protein FimT